MDTLWRELADALPASIVVQILLLGLVAYIAWLLAGFKALMVNLASIVLKLSAHTKLLIDRADPQISLKELEDAERREGVHDTALIKNILNGGKRRRWRR